VVPVQQLLREIRERGCPGSSDLLVRYLNQGRADAERPHIAPRKVTQILLTNPGNLTWVPHGHRCRSRSCFAARPPRRSSSCGQAEAVALRSARPVICSTATTMGASNIPP
jgi:hypothetical protein